MRFACAAVLSIFAWVSFAAAQTLSPAHLSIIGVANSPPGFAQACGDYHWLCRWTGHSINYSDAELKSLAERVNTAVNQGVASRPPLAERWTLPDQWGGDCVSYALRKLQLLLQAGAPPRTVFLATVLTETSESHAVLIVRMSDADYVLDNLRNSIVPWSQTRYTFVKAQDARDRSRWNLVLLGPRARRS